MYDRLRLICSQPHRRDKGFGIAMIRILSNTDSVKEVSLTQIMRLHPDFVPQISINQVDGKYFADPT